MSLRLLIDVAYLERLFCFKYQIQLVLQHGGVYLLAMDTSFSDVTAPRATGIRYSGFNAECEESTLNLYSKVGL